MLLMVFCLPYITCRGFEATALMGPGNQSTRDGDILTLLLRSCFEGGVPSNPTSSTVTGCGEGYGDHFQTL